MTDRLGIIGAGKIGESLLAGLLRSGVRPDDVVVVEKFQERAESLYQRYGVRDLSLAEAAAFANTLLIAVKPQDMGELLVKMAPAVTSDHLIVTVAAGIPTGYVERQLGEGVPVVRVMPNTPALVDQAMSVVAAGAYANADHLAAAEKIFSPVGKVLRLPENQLDAVTALSGSGPAYFFFLVEAMIDAGILLGLPRAIAADLIVQTALGSAVMLRDSGEHPVQLREGVTSPGGTTIMAIKELEKHGVRAALLEAIEAARDRSVELGKLYD
ncbi:pyrroline-5-carboxylate reductase [Fodinicola feengrottensis]|uniref:Pyrroline-5-carboxylate reductase n=1 Tax=Fodinicola feengrottensis TaxID=435914 RepID=A0ABN2I3Y8_9ACTN|nr:pyrroline-5-carboxylate reductase [Fodinicola feengrottensis]